MVSVLGTDAVLAALTGGIRNGDAITDETLPYIGVNATCQEEHPTGSGNYIIDMDVTISADVDEYMTSAGARDQTAYDAAMTDRWGRTVAICKYDDLPALLSAAVTNFTCKAVLYDRGSPRATGQRRWSKIFPMTLMAFSRDE